MMTFGRRALIGGVAALSLLAAVAGAAQAQNFSLKIGWTTGDSANDPYSIGARAFKEEVERRSEGQIEVLLFSNRALGDEKSLLEGMRLGTVDMAILSSAVSSQVVPEYALPDLPFLFATESQARAVMDGPVGDILAEKMSNHGVIVLSYLEAGFRSMANNVRPIQTLEDTSRVKFRVIQSPIYIRMIELLGGSAVPMAWGEVYTAVQQGTIDGLEAPPVVIEQNKFAEVVKYLSLTNHTYNALELMISKRSLNRMPEELQQIVRDSAKAATATQRQRSDEVNASVLDLLTTQGVQVNAIENLAPFREAVAPIYEEYRKIIGSDLLDLTLSEVASH